MERIVALVNNEVITLSELEEAGARFFHQVKESTLPSEREEKLKKAREEILNQLIENKLLEQEIKKRKVEVSDRDLDSAIEGIMKENRLTENEMKMALAKEGMTYSVYRRHIREELGKMRLVNREIKSKIVLKEEDLRKIYQENIKEYTDPLEVKVQQIFLPVSPGATEEQIGPSVKKLRLFWKGSEQAKILLNWPGRIPGGRKPMKGESLAFSRKKNWSPSWRKRPFP